MHFPRTERKRSVISLIPLIDVSIFLLIFFMVSGTIEKFEIIPVDPPIAKSGKLVDEGHVFIVLGRYDEVIINDEIVPLEDIKTVLEPEFKGNPNKVVTVKADASVPANRVIDVMDAIKSAGGRQLSVVTQSEGEADDK